MRIIVSTNRTPESRGLWYIELKDGQLWLHDLFLDYRFKAIGVLDDLRIA